MSSLPRYLIIHDGSSFHLTWQCHNKSCFMKEDWTKKFYYDQLLKWKDFYGVSIYAYNIADNTIHLIGKIIRKEGISDLMKKINCRFSKEYNKRNNRSGQVVMERFKSQNIQSDKHVLDIMVHIDLDLCTGKKVKHPNKYKWTSYNYYAYGKNDPLITPAPSYLELGANDKKRQGAYRRMARTMITKGPKKENYPTARFIGDPNWVQEHYGALKGWFKKRYLTSKNGPQIDYHLS